MTTTQTPADTRRVPGWRRILDAFMADPDRIVTNVELGQIPGVQAFHQRLSDLGRFGYVLTSAILLKPGRYAYALVGVSEHTGSWPFLTDRPYTDRLPIVSDDHDAYAADIARALATITAKTEDLAKRGGASAESPLPDAARSRALRDAVSTLQDALPEGRLIDLGTAGREDLLTLAHTARDEIDALRAARDEADAESSRGEADLLTIHHALNDSAVPINADGIAEAIHALRTNADRTPPGPQLMRKALEHYEQPMHYKRIAAYVMENGGDAYYKGATPETTIVRHLVKSDKDPSGVFVKVSSGVFALRDWEGKADEFGNPLLELDPVR
jgi:hypothetical protein